MPNPINSVTFTPDTDGTIECTATYSVQQSGTTSDWGGSDPGSVMKVNKVSGGTLLQTGVFQPCTRTRMSQTYKATFPVNLSDGAITVSLNGTGGATGTSISYWDVDLSVVFIKR